MENIQILKYCPWISEKLDVKEYFDEYHQVLDETNGMKPHNEQFCYEESMKDFFQLPDDLDAPFSRRSTPALSLTMNINSDSASGNKSKGLENGLERSQSGSHIEKNEYGRQIPLRSKSADDIENPTNDCEDQLGDLFSLEKLEKECSVDLLTVDGELAPRDLCESGPIGDSGRVTNWYAGAYMDGVIPDGGPEKLVTLACQARELYKRETVKDYTRLRHRLLKYASTVRMVMRKENSPENIPLKEDISKSCLRDTIFNVRIQRPYHKKSYSKKGINRYPKHSQEMYMLGSQSLTELRDAITCINDLYVHEDMSDNPDISRCASLPSSQSLFKSAFFYINGVFFSDMRNSNARDNSETLRNWAKRYPTIGDMTLKKMEAVTLNDLELRLGYPYVYQHLGSCEHIITFTDVRLHHRTDIQDIHRYPLSRGNPIKLSVVCYLCNLFLANWILKDDPRIPAPYAHLCDKCLKLFFYDEDGRKMGDFKLFAFFDEFAAEKAKNSQERSHNVQIKIGSETDDPTPILIEPYVEERVVFARAGIE